MSLSLTRDPAREMAAHSDALRDISAEARLSVGTADATVGSSYDRFNNLWDRHMAALDKISSLQSELSEERSKDLESVAIKAKLKKQKAKIKQKGETQRAALNSMTPLINALALRAPAIISTYLPIGIDATNGTGNSPRKAMERLLKKMFVPEDPLYEEYGVPALALLKAMAAMGGDDDWSMIEQFLMGVISGTQEGAT